MINSSTFTQVITNYENAELGQRERAMLDFAMAICRCDTITEQHFKSLEEVGFDREDAWDIAAIAAFFAMSNRLAHLTDMRPNTEFYNMGRVPRNKSQEKADGEGKWRGSDNTLFSWTLIGICYCTKRNMEYLWWSQQNLVANLKVTRLCLSFFGLIKEYFFPPGSIKYWTFSNFQLDYVLECNSFSFLEGVQMQT